MSAALDGEELGLLRKDFLVNPQYRLMQNAVTKVAVDDVALDRDVVTGHDHSMSHTLDDWKATNQEKSGRCWMFAGLNLLRAGAMKKLGVKAFEFSQNHTLFWDKLERANYFLEAIIQTADRDLDDRTVAYLLDHAAADGGQWNMFVAIVKKYGVVPKPFMPETQSSSDTARMNSILRSVLRQGASSLREAARQGTDEARAEKMDVLRIVYRVLAIHLGNPPEEFLWQWTDDEKKFHRAGLMTPQEFLATYVDLPLGDYVCLVHDPRPSNPTDRTFTVEYLGNVTDAPPVTYLNVDMRLLRDVASRTLQEGEPVWFGCDCSKMLSNDLGVWDDRLFDFPGVYDTDFTLSKSDRLLYHETRMTHAMLLTGVDILNGSPRRWRVENSWGPEKGRDGFYSMSDSWFAEHVFEIAARRQMLPYNLQQALELDPIVLPAWDPMGALAL